jgi:hypothetical protein
MNAVVRACSVAVAVTLMLAPVFAARTLDIYFIDVEGGQATLIVTPAGQSFLIDTGFPGEGTFTSRRATRAMRAMPIAFSPPRAMPASRASTSC